MRFGCGFRFWDDDVYPMGQGLIDGVSALAGSFHSFVSFGWHGVLLPILYGIRQDC